MTREIKFRAWHKADHKFIPVEAPSINGQMCKSVYNDDWENLEDVVIEQFTGLRDKNGREIYEGDIVAGEKGFVSYVRGVVKYRGLAFCFVGSTITGREWIYTITNPDITQDDSIEVIGDIHTTPELLEAKE